jgi:hypothetical protein
MDSMTAPERELLLLLITVSGIGPKWRLGRSADLAVRDFAAAIVQADIQALELDLGIGKKTPSAWWSAEETSWAPARRWRRLAARPSPARLRSRRATRFCPDFPLL